MGFNLRQKLEETFADVNPFDNGATAQTVRAKRTKTAPAQTLKVQNRPQFQQNNQPVYQQQQQKQFKIQSPSLNINNPMPKVQTFGQSNDPLKVGQVKTPQIQTPQKAPMMLTTQGQQQWRQKQQQMNPVYKKPELDYGRAAGQVGGFIKKNVVDPTADFGLNLLDSASVIVNNGETLSG